MRRRRAAWLPSVVGGLIALLAALSWWLPRPDPPDREEEEREPEA